ncbi:DUF3040 domain-containing protein [Arcanobacterium hippocoleae]|uniref:DUF3040 domain-containing protein n=1 Tax=Arcanobacterium hippocoleae TaxID=149017 RepID=A0ABU1T0X7_9ACTO|nr:DUF3040 domain-containing protein [Arcanobacterium hippocoleae]MDR6939012.1 hypothetical protein [Arcanobacterium hippocoleae]
MALSEYERQMLADLESQLGDTDAQFADALARENGVPMRWAVAAKNLILGLIIAVAGLLTVLAGVATEFLIIGVAGVIIVFAGFWYLSLGFQKKPFRGGKPHRGQGPKDDRAGGFMQRQAEEWVKRMQDGNRS